MFALQAASSLLPQNGEDPRETGIEVATEVAEARTAERDQDVPDPFRETAEFLMAAALQLLSQPAPATLLQKRPEVSESAGRAGVKTVDDVGALTQSAVSDTTGTQPVVTAAVPGMTVPPPSAVTVEPASQSPVAAPVAGIAKALEVTASMAAQKGADRETMPVNGSERSVVAAQVSGRPVKVAARGAHESASVRGTEAPAPVNSGQIFDRPLLEVVVEDAATDQSAELAVQPEKVELSSDGAAVGKSPQTLIGGAGVMKTEPAATPAAGETVTSPGHEQILVQVKEQIGKAVFSTDDGRVVLRLHPEELGSLRIDVKLDDQRLRLHIVAENPAVREALAANLDSLKEALSRQQIVVERFDVTTGQGQDQQQLFREHRQQVQDGQGNRPGRMVTDQAEDGGVVDHRAMNAYWAPQDGGLLNVRF